MVSFIKSKLVSLKVRKAADRLKEDKEVIADKVITKLSQALRRDSSFVMPLWMYQLMADIFAASARALRVVATDAEVQTQLKTFIANVIGDIALRLNEMANVTDKITSNRELAECIERIEKTYSSMGKELQADRDQREVEMIKASLEKGDMSSLVSISRDDVLSLLLADSEIPDDIKRYLPDLCMKNLAKHAEDIRTGKGAYENYKAAEKKETERSQKEAVEKRQKFYKEVIEVLKRETK